MGRKSDNFWRFKFIDLMIKKGRNRNEKRKEGKGENKKRKPRFKMRHKEALAVICFRRRTLPAS